VLLDEKKNAVGVKYVKHGVTQVARVSKELILSAGTYGTPQILLKSGIGSKAKLSQANVSQVFVQVSYATYTYAIFRLT
jgi:choline dehydrogenase-like flavoprotein